MVDITEYDLILNDLVLVGIAEYDLLYLSIGISPVLGVHDCLKLQETIQGENQLGSSYTNHFIQHSLIK